MFEKDLHHIRGALAQAEFCKLICEGLTKSEACAEMRINPGAMIQARRENPAFNTAIRDAEGYRVDMLADTLLTIHEEIENPIMAGVVSKNIQWLASKRQRDIYGDKTDITVDHKISITAAIESANSRLSRFIDSKALELIDSVTDNISVEPVKIIDNQGIPDADPFE